MSGGLTGEVDEKSLAAAYTRDISSDGLARWGLAFLLVYTIVRNIFAALAKPFWFDELLTLAIARQPGFVATWKAAGSAKDSNPPPFYIVERFFASLPANEHIAYRLASILGFAAMLGFLFVFVKRRNGERIALICIAPLMLTELLRPYAVEARPYALVAACLAFAFVCYQNAPKTGWMTLMGVAMAAAECLHYYSIFYFLPFAVAETAAAVRIQRIRWTVWLAIAAGFIPLAYFWPLLSEIRHYYGPHLWDPPSLFATGVTYSLLIKTNAPIALGLVAGLAGVILFTNAGPAETSSDERNADRNERWLAVTFLALPLLLFVAAKITSGAYTIRYSLPALFGIPMGLGYACRLLGRRGIVLIAACTFIAITLQETFLWRTAVHDVLHFESPVTPIERLVSRAGRAELPVVVSDDAEYFQIIHYAANSNRFVAVVDPAAAVAYTGSDSLDLELPVMRCCMWLQVYSYSKFAAQHARFLLYSGGGQWDWWTARLVNDGDSLQLLAEEQNRRVYLVTLKPAGN